jgi:RNA-binding protein PNO1
MEDSNSELSSSGGMITVTRKRKKNPTEAMDVTDSDQMSYAAKRPQYPPVDASKTASGKPEFRRVPVPSHRFSPLKEKWMKIFTPIVEHLKLQIRMNLRTRSVELKTSEATTDPSALQKGADFVKAFMLGFDVDDSLALVRLDDLYLDSFEVQDGEFQFLKEKSFCVYVD